MRIGSLLKASELNPRDTHGHSVTFFQNKYAGF